MKDVNLDRLDKDAEYNRVSAYVVSAVILSTDTLTRMNVVKHWKDDDMMYVREILVYIMGSAVKPRKNLGTNACVVVRGTMAHDVNTHAQLLDHW